MALTSEQLKNLDLNRYRADDGRFIDRRYEWARPGFLIVPLDAPESVPYMGVLCEQMDRDDPDVLERAFAVCKDAQRVLTAEAPTEMDAQTIFILTMMQSVLDVIEAAVGKAQAAQAP